MSHTKSIKPGWLMNHEIGSFAESTIIQRKPQILNRLIKENEYPESMVEKLKKFRNEIANEPVSFLPESAHDAKSWNDRLSLLLKDRWLALPWFFAESFFYRRLLEITEYYKKESPYFHQDPFALQKQAQIDKDIISLGETNWLFLEMDESSRFSGLLHAVLWGNRADLSNEHVALSHTKDEYHGAAHLIELIDETIAIEKYFTTGAKSIAYFLDNVGRELFSDLALIQFLLENGWAKEITVVVKSAPFFVSDAMLSDVYQSIECLKNSTMDAAKEVVLGLEKYIQEGKLFIIENDELCNPVMYSEMPPPFFDWVGNYDLLIFKGDANYRRVVEDRHWPTTTIIGEITHYFTTNLLLVRTLKSELMVGLEQVVSDELFLLTPDWLISGNYGIIQFLIKNEEAVT